MSTLKWFECYAEPGAGHIIDGIDAETGLTLINAETEAQVKERYPNAVRMEIDVFLAAKAEKQNAPVEWIETTLEKYDEMLGCLPPAVCNSGGFMVGEPHDHCAKTGKARFQAYVHIKGKYYAASRPMTIAEFKLLTKEVIMQAAVVPHEPT